jgi:hypothetical protein
LTPRQGDGTKIPSYNMNILAAMTPNSNGFEFSVFDIIWEEIKTILENPLKSCGYALYIMHMIERVTTKTCYYEKEHHPLRIKNDLKALVEDRRAVAGQPGSPPPRAARRSGQQWEKPMSLIQKIFSLLFEMCKSQHATDVKAQHERRARRKDTKFVKEIHSHLNLQPLALPLPLREKKARRLNPLKKGSFALMLILRCSSGMVTRASAASDLALVERPVHPTITLRCLTPLLQLILKW